MTDFTVTITDPAQLAGITWACEQHNATLPPVAEGDEPAPPFDDAAYIQWVIEQAAISYADQQLRAEYQQHYENAVSARAAG
jgi:hypothetical protein